MTDAARRDWSTATATSCRSPTRPPISLGEGSRRSSGWGGSAPSSACATCTPRWRAPTRPDRSRTAAWSWRFRRRSRRVRRPSSAPRPATPRRRRRPMPPRPGSTRSSCSRAARSRSASCSRRSSPGRGRRDRRQLRPGAGDRPGARRTGRQPGHAGQLGQPVPHPGQRTAAFEVCDDLDARRTSSRSPSATPATSARTGRVPRLRVRGPHPLRATDVGVPGRGCRAARPRATGGPPGNGRDRDPDRRSGVRHKALAARDESGGGSRR